MRERGTGLGVPRPLGEETRGRVRGAPGDIRRQLERGRGQELTTAIRQQVARAAVGAKDRMLVVRFAVGAVRVVCRKQARSGVPCRVEGHEEEIGIVVGVGAAYDEIGAVGRPRQRRERGVHLEDRTRGAAGHVHDPDIKERLPAPVATVADRAAVGRPRAEGVDDVGLGGQRPPLSERHVVDIYKVKLVVLVAARVDGHEQVVPRRRPRHEPDALVEKRDLPRLAEGLAVAADVQYPGLVEPARVRDKS